MGDKLDKVTFDVYTHLQMFKEELYGSWKNKILDNSNRVSETFVVEESGELLFHVIFEAVSLPTSKIENYLIQHAKKIASYHLNENISSIVYIVNCAKEAIFASISKVDLSAAEMASVHFQLSQVMNQLLYNITYHIEEIKNAQFELQKSFVNEAHEDRLTLLGKMTSSFVHEFRNPLTTVHGFIQLLYSENPNLPYMDIIASELDQLKKRISQFLTLSKSGQVENEKSQFSINELLEQVTSFIYPRLLESNVMLETNLTDDLIVNGFSEEIRQVIINLIFNAIDVLSEQADTSTIKIRGYHHNDTVMLDISNPGPKIPEHLLEVIFEPFFTTKKSGTGLGLFVCKEIIEKHNGKLICTSDEDWTTFKIILPTQ